MDNHEQQAQTISDLSLTPNHTDPSDKELQPIDRDILCANCEYNLRTQLPIHDCPECGHPIAESVKNRQLAYAPLDYIEKLRSATTVVAVAPLILFLINITMNANKDIPEESLFVIRKAVQFILYSFIVFAIFSLTKNSPFRPRIPKTILTLRITAPLSYILALVLAVLINKIKPGLIPVTLLTITLLSLALAFFTFLKFYANINLGLLPNKHRGSANIYAYLFLIILTILAFSNPTLMITNYLFDIALILTPERQQQNHGIYRAVLITGIFAFFILAITLMVFLFRFRSTLTKLHGVRSRLDLTTR
ncbi:hypothetical protein [Poriferisphaera sp. WC338]|uniref:hypothetical protein n=1 Tax=Poriferisphaera sp. WC338 TaxID=3425129 RepID=UPI003D81666C